MTEESEAGVERLGSLVVYQEGSVVSRKILSAPGGNITLFAFAAGEELSEHTTPYDAMVQILDGRARIRIDDRDYELETGEMILLPADRPHAVMAEHRFKMMLVMLKA